MRFKSFLFLLFFIVVLLLSGCNKETAVSSNTENIQENIFYSDIASLKKFTLNETTYEITDSITADLRNRYYSCGNLSKTEINVFGYISADEDNLYHFFGDSVKTANCIYAIDNDNGYTVVELKFKDIDSDRLGMSAGTIIENESFQIAGINVNTTAEKAIKLLGTPTETEKDDNGNIIKAVYKKETGGKVDYSITLEWAAGIRLWQVMIVNTCD